MWRRPTQCKPISTGVPHISSALNTCENPHQSDNFHEVTDEKGLEIIDLTIQIGYIYLFVSSPPKHAPSLLTNWFKIINYLKYNHHGEQIK